MPNPVPDTVVCEIVRFELPVLLRTTDCEAVLPMTTLPKFTGEGLGASCPVAVAANRKTFKRIKPQTTCVDGGPKRFTSVLLFRASGRTAGIWNNHIASRLSKWRADAVHNLFFRPLARVGQVSEVHDGTRKCRTRLDFGRVWDVQPDGYREYTSRFSCEGSEAERARPEDARTADTRPCSRSTSGLQEGLVNRKFPLASLSSAAGIVVGSRRKSRSQFWMRNRQVRKTMKRDCGHKRTRVL